MGKVIKQNQIDEELSLESRLSLQEQGHSAIEINDDQKVIRQKAPSVDQAKLLLDKAKKEAEGIKTRAKALYQQVEAKIEEAKKQGFEAGKKEGLATMTELMGKIEKKNEDMLNSLTKESLSLVFEIAKKIIGESFEHSEKSLVSMIQQGLQSAMGDQLVILVNPTDYVKLKDHQNQLLQYLHGSQRLTLKASEAVKPNGCIIESEMGTIEGDLEDQLLAIHKALGLGQE